jgi:hypothetical protein
MTESSETDFMYSYCYYIDCLCYCWEILFVGHFLELFGVSWVLDYHLDCDDFGEEFVFRKSRYDWTSWDKKDKLLVGFAAFCFFAGWEGAIVSVSLPLVLIQFANLSCCSGPRTSSWDGLDDAGISIMSLSRVQG